MLVAELQELEEVRSLVTNGQQLGVLTFGDVATAVSEVELDESDVEDLYGHLEKNGIELVEDLDPAQKPPPRASLRRQARSQAPEAALDLKPDMTTDSLQLFLKDIGKVRLLTAARRSSSPSGSSAATSTPSRRWSSRTSAWSSRSRRTTATRACPSST